MLVEELKQKYKKYSFELYGKPLKEKCIPYTFLPKNKDINKCEVVELEIIEKEHKEYAFSFNKQQWKKPITKKGYVRAYIK